MAGFTGLRWISRFGRMPNPPTHQDRSRSVAWFPLRDHRTPLARCCFETVAFTEFIRWDAAFKFRMKTGLPDAGCARSSNVSMCFRVCSPIKDLPIPEVGELNPLEC